ncbi:hypothetical protein ERW51_17720 [Aliivibrio finisterrensis]|uniref:hypothetical protein n=1 Tax=Aliivibrio finisterrensis TaxID=511998 RepID=UPI00101EE0ED|nr:hypothetical protein [Aliivibrio finisterrensis]RYU64234.1 hypothetical protein ERW54_18225 [Aliivibrio finisterrensis]RYU67637.1 hypothetical protein ERW51_17720 [Aliivibrio finisterrensis]RYU70661.1 hypothetical protein ERW48_18220 [Aliivibrio finisterrensis]
MKTKEELEGYIWLLGGMAGTSLVLLCLIPTLDVSNYPFSKELISVSLGFFTSSLPFLACGLLYSRDTLLPGDNSLHEKRLRVLFIYLIVGALLFLLGICTFLFSLGFVYGAIFLVSSFLALLTRSKVMRK